MAFFRLVPNLTIMAPKDFKELEDMLEFAISLGKPVVIRYPRGGESIEKFEKHDKIEYGKSEILKHGKDVTIIAIGKTVDRARKVAEKLEMIDDSNDVLKTFTDYQEESNIRFIKVHIDELDPWNQHLLSEVPIPKEFLVVLILMIQEE